MLLFISICFSCSKGVATAIFSNVNASLKDPLERNFVPVVREGNSVPILSWDLVVGDILFINPGDKLDVDCLLFESEDVYVNEADVTGEPDDIEKQAENADNADRADPFLYKGSLISKGHGRALVLKVGPDSPTL